MTKNIKPFIKNQFPKYILETDSLFPDFVEAYYEWASLDGNFQAVSYDLESLQNIDVAYNKFAEEFIAEYIDNLPDNILVDRTTLIKKINELYKAKGTPKAVKFLVRILTNKDSDVFFPSAQIFKSSDAIWNRDISVRFVITSGLLTSFQDILATIDTGTQKINVAILKIQRVRNTTNLFEAFLDVKYKLLIPNGGTISTDTFTGELVRSTARKEIRSRGAKFAIGDIFEINNSGGTGTKIKVTRVDSDTGLRSFDIVEFGVGYETSFLTELLPLSVTESAVSKNLNIKLIDDNDIVTQNIDITTDDNISQIEENILITKFDYVDNVNYFQDNTYVTDTTYVDSNLITVKVGEDGGNAASILFELGYVFEYPGYYSTNVGFPSDTSFLQDGEYYQQFSYVINSSAQFSEYETALKALVHPAGMKAFGNYSIERQLDILISIRDRLNILETDLQDSTTISDIINNKFVFKNVADTISFSELISKSFSRTLAETSTISDSTVKSYTKPVADTMTLSDVINTKQYQKNIADIINLMDINIKSIQKTISENITANDVGGIINNMYYSYNDLVFYSKPYWDFGYTENETIIT